MGRFIVRIRKTRSTYKIMAGKSEDIIGGDDNIKMDLKKL
jgi:hypothetical protein